jgi:hypothetical protein
MPLRDHFRPPLDDAHSWEGFYGGWPAVIVQHLRKTLPTGYEAGPRVYLGTSMEVDVATFEKAPPTFYEYEVRIYDARRDRRLVAAIEIVSPANKDQPEYRNVFVAKCAALLQKGVAVNIVDLVTVRQSNLYADLLTFIEHSDPTLRTPRPHLYAAACRWVRPGDRAPLQAWSIILTLGQPLPTLPLWLSETRVVPLDLEPTYEQACHDLWIT